MADGGTIFLDEVAELPHSTQVRLLRVLQTGEFMRVGSSKVLKTNVRVVAATNISLQTAIADGRFREDLYYRLNTVPIEVPPLRERRSDIYLLFRKFASDVALQYRMPSITLSDEARQMLESYYWRGNIRQLKNVAEQISAIEEARVITPQILSRYLPDQDGVKSVSVISSHSRSANDMSDERELLYKVLFDMKSDINDLKRMLAEALHKSPDVSYRQPANEYKALLPSPTIDKDYEEVEQYTDSEDVTNELTERPAQTKADAQREQILRALRNNNGRRRDAARELFMSERTLYRKIKELGISEF